MLSLRLSCASVLVVIMSAGAASADVTLRTETFDSIGPSGTSPPTGWTIGRFSPAVNRESGGNLGGNGLTVVSDSPVLVVDDGSGTGSSNGLSYNYGTTGAADRALGNIPKTTNGDRIIQVAITNNSGLSLRTITLTYTGEQWHRGESKSDSGPEKLRVYYSATSATSGFVSMGSSFEFTAPQNLSGQPQAALDGNAAANRTVISGTYTPATPIANGTTFYIRWYDWNDNNTADHGLAVDDVTVTGAEASVSVDTLAATDVQPNTATLNGQLTYLAAEPQADVYFRWGTSPGNLSEFTSSQTLTAVGPFSASLSGLTPETVYYFKAVAIAGSAVAEGAVRSFFYTDNYGLQFNGSSSYVTMGPAPSLGAATFTLETWFKKTGPGQTTDSGSGGVTAVPLVCKGRGESDGSNVDCNYFFGIGDTGVLAADFEDMASGLNHPATGTALIQENVWYHAAATYDGTTWRLYLNGQLDAEVVANATPRFDSIQHFGIGTALNSTGVAAGRFQGVMDEVRVWNFARDLAAIRGTMNAEVESGAGMLGRWGLNEGIGGAAGNSVPSGASGLIIDGTWAIGAPFDINLPPDAPTLVAPADGGDVRGPNVQLTAHVSDPEAEALEVKFFGRMLDAPPPPPFTIISLPDTQYYSESYPSTFATQVQWVLDNRAALNIAYVAHLGDIVNVASQTGQWYNANQALSLFDAVPSLPIGLSVGNHDEDPNGNPAGTGNYNYYFPYTRYATRPWYGGHYGADYDNHYVLFSAGGMDFIAIHFEYDPAANPSVLSWAGNVLQTYSNRRAIVVSHYILDLGTPGTFGAQGAAIYNALKVRPNLFLMLCGHNHGEARRVDVYNGHTVHSVLADYQSRSNGGDGWLRIMEFVPASDEIRVKTYSPKLGQYETDGDSQFTLSYPMAGVPFTELATVSGVASGTDTSHTWSGLPANHLREWYVTVSDGHKTTTGPTWSFHTVSVSPDFDGDYDVDVADFGFFQLCFNGPDRPMGQVYCGPADLDGDMDADVADFSVFLSCFNGAGRAPAVSCPG